MKPVTKKDILTKLRDNRDTIERYGVRRIGIFGSYARDEQTPDSDIDILVEFGEVTIKEYLDLKEFMETLLGHKVDLVFSDTLKPRLKNAVLGEAIYVEG